RAFCRGGEIEVKKRIRRGKTKRGKRPYASNWDSRCHGSRTATLNLCVCGWHWADLVHHLYYSKRRCLWLRPIYGCEVPGWDVVPVCDSCHQRLHTPSVWVKHPSNPDLDRNIPSVVWQLRLNYLLISLWWFWLLLLVLSILLFLQVAS
ncbi:MAG TPA: hypothetical protein V6D18_20655, partial [Thermosynechococcaceae cyanobacterium]